ncbi:RidA family protein [soil metagenome]
MTVRRLSSGGPWEETVGYSRAVAAGPWVVVAGTTSTVDGQVTGVGDPRAHARTAFGIALAAIAKAGCAASDVVQTRMYLTDMAFQDQVGAVHRELFGEIRPVATMLAVAGMAHPDHLVEIELTAYRE